MSKRSNINIEYSEYSFNYLIEYSPVDDIHQFKYKSDSGIDFLCGDLIRNLNNWYYREPNESEEHNVIQTNTATIKIYFPNYSLETYKSGGLYVLDIYMYIADKYISLGSFLLDRMNALAVNSPTNFLDQNYFESIEVSIPDPYSILYSDDCTEFRMNLKGDVDYNNDSTNLLVSLHPVSKYEDYIIIKDDCDGGQNAIPIYKSGNDFLHTELSYIDKQFKIDFIYNLSYGDDFYDYLENTYKWDISAIYIKHDFRLLSKDFGITGKDSNFYKGSYVNTDAYPYKPINIKNLDIYKNYLSSWDKYNNGISIVCFTHIYLNGKTDDHQQLCLCSNSIPITPELFSSFIEEDISSSLKTKIIDCLENMNIIEIPNIITPESPNSIQRYDVDHSYTKSNRIVPVFYRVRELSNLVIHPEVAENICINLDTYKSKVDYFILQIEGVKFKEFGMSNSGTIFKIVGEMLPKNISSGTYYILNQNNELVVTGKYIYEL